MKKMLLLSAMTSLAVVSSNPVASCQVSLNNLRKEVKSESKTIKGSIDGNIHKLKSVGYEVYQTKETSDKVLRQLLVIDQRLLEHQDNLISRIGGLKDASLIDSIRKYKPTPYKPFDTYDNDILELHKFISGGQVNEIRKSYYGAFNNHTVEHYLNKLHESLIIGDSLIYRMEYLLASKSQVLEKKRQEEALAAEVKHQEFLQNQAKIREQNERREREAIESQKRADEEAAKEAEIRANLPSKEAVKAKYRNYTHKTGHVFEMFPTGFTPINNKGVYDYVTIFSIRYKARYRETDPSGQGNTLIIDFYDSGNVSEVMVFGQGEMMYNAKYNDAAAKPYEIRARTKDKKYYAVLKRDYDYSTGKVVETFYYQDQETGMWVR